MPSTTPTRPDPPRRSFSASPVASSNRRLHARVLGGFSCLGLAVVVTCIALFLISLSFTVEGSPRLTLNASTAVPTQAPSAEPTTEADTITGTILLQEDFSSLNTSRLRSREDEVIRYAIVVGAYLIEIKQAEKIGWSLVEDEYADIAVQVDVTSKRKSVPVAGGIIFGYQDENNFYLYSLASDGFYRLELLQDGEWLSLIDWTPSQAINIANQERNAVNVLRVEQAGDRIALFVNGVLLEETLDETFERGRIGLAASTFDRGNARIQFDNLVVTTLERDN